MECIKCKATLPENAINDVFCDECGGLIPMYIGGNNKEVVDNAKKRISEYLQSNIDIAEKHIPLCTRNIVVYSYLLDTMGSIMMNDISISFPDALCQAIEETKSSVVIKSIINGTPLPRLSELDSWTLTEEMAQKMIEAGKRAIDSNKKTASIYIAMLKSAKKPLEEHTLDLIKELEQII